MKSAFTTAAGALLAVTSVCVPAVASERDPQLGTYLVWNFGAVTEQPADRFHYGLRLDYDSRVAALDRAPPLLLLNVGNRSGSETFLNGSSLRQLSLQMNQAGALGALGGSAAAVTAAVVVGVSATAVVISAGDDNESAAPGGSTGDTGGGGTGGDTTGGGTGGTGGGTGGTGGGTGGTGGGTGGTGGGTGGTGGVPLGGLLGSNLSDMRGTALLLGNADRTDPDYQQWLDGGTGHMGDLQHAR